MAVGFDQMADDAQAAGVEAWAETGKMWVEPSRRGGSRTRPREWRGKFLYLQCSLCERMLRATKFYRQANGWSSYCKPCKKAKRRKDYQVASDDG